MTVSQLMDKLSTLHPDMPVVIDYDGELEDICFGESQVIKVKDEVTGENNNVFMLCPCFCDIDLDDLEDEDEINSRPELN